VSGADIVLAGQFDCVTITCCTLDPGNAAPRSSQPHTSPPSLRVALAADHRELLPSTLWIEGSVEKLTVERSITGPIRTRGNGQVSNLTITDSIVQAIAIPGPGSMPVSLLTDPAHFGAALVASDGDLNLTRTTILGRMVVHRLWANECILHDVVEVDDLQRGCIRFSAWADGSSLPRQYESVRIAPRASLFTSEEFGQPGYCQLLATADSAILPGANPPPPTPPTIIAGAQGGSEMGAFARNKNPIKERGLLIKYQEFMPAGLVPILIYVT
jgi:hypothetical protein